MAGMYVLGGSRTSSGKRAGPTIYELNAQGEGRSARDVPRLVAAGLTICWRAGRRELITMGALEVLSGIGVAAEVVVGRRVLEAILVAKAEHELFARIGELFAGRSVLLISHRFSTVRSADRIYVLNEGRLVEAGDARGAAGPGRDVRGAVHAAGVALPVALDSSVSPAPGRNQPEPVSVTLYRFYRVRCHSHWWPTRCPERAARRARHWP